MASVAWGVHAIWLPAGFLAFTLCLFIIDQHYLQCSTIGGMIRSLTFLLAAATLPVAGTTAVAAAEPAPPTCSYNLSPPQVVDVSGTEMVTATLSPGACDRSSTYLSVACIQMAGSPGPPSCEQNNGVLTAQVFYAPYRQGATYVSTGRGCANTGNPPQPVCTPVGPVTATL